MAWRSIGTTVALTSILLALAGCGPSATGLKHRAEANQRIDTINAKLTYDQADRFFKSGEFDKALDQVELSLQRNPASSDSNLLKGRILIEMNRLEPAMSALVEAIEVDDQNHAAHYFAGIILQRWSRHDEAFEEYSRAFELEPASVQYLTASAEALIAADQFQLAEEMVSAHLESFEYNAALRQLLGQIAMLRGEPKTAVSFYSDARMLNPDDQMLLEELSRAQFAAGQHTECIESLRELQNGSLEKRTDLMLLEARCLTLTEQQSAARALYIDITRRNPTNVDAWAELGSLAWEIGDYQRVGVCGSRILSLAPDRYEGYMLKAIHAREYSLPAGAIDWMRQAADHAPNAALPHLLLGHMLEQQGNHEEAVIAYENAVNADPESAEARAMLKRLSKASAQGTTLSDSGSAWTPE